MRKFLFRTFILLTILAVFVGILPAKTAVAYTDYYSSITATSGTELLGQLHNLITTTHTKYTSYADCKNPVYVLKTDAGTNGNVKEFYSQADIASSWGSGKQGTWNREHVWCQSLSNGLWGQSGGGADMHHIRPVETGLNSARGNDLYGEVSNGKAVYYEDSSNNPVALGGYVSGGVFEPLDSVKGDVARILFYVYTHYNTYTNGTFGNYATTNGNGDSSYFGELDFTDIVSANSETNAIELLLEWNESDPVDDTERNRNEAVYAIQGNRNPFIDNENYADAIWGDGEVIPSETELQSLKISRSAFTLTVDETASLTITAVPSYVDNSVTWTSSDESVATVSESGHVTAVAEGQSVITATSTKYSSISISAIVTVVPKQAAVSLNISTMQLYLNDSATLVATATGEISWSVSDENVVTVSDGEILAVGVGEATVTATCGEVSATCSVSVTDVKSSDFIAAVNEAFNATNSEQKFRTLKNALSIYDRLFESDKSSVTGTYGLLTEEIENYNAKASARNVSANENLQDMFDKTPSLSVSAIAVLIILKRILR